MHPYLFGTEFGGKHGTYGGEQHRVELLAQAEEVAEGEDDHLFGMGVQPLSDLRQHCLSETQVSSTLTHQNELHPAHVHS